MIERIPFGRTGHRSSRVIFGAAALGAVDQETADSLLPLLDEHGVNHLDVARSYGDAELRLAPWLRTRRNDFFLATKTGERTAGGARRELEESLSRLGVDAVDLIQLHNLVEPDEWETAHGPGGAVQAMVAARAEGLVKAIGVTGHGLRIAGMHLASLERFDLDSVLLPYNYSLLQLDDYRRDVEQLLAVCETRQVAVQTIKSIARRRWSDPSAESGRSWYEPIRERAALQRGVRFVLGRPGLFVNSSSDYELLADMLDAAEPGAPVPDEQALAADQAEQDIQPLFDGSELERI
jgi:aryl-alcohol dehydrogenase-like predicted oxidoreductase